MSSDKEKIAVVLLSGGMDSSVVLAQAISDGFVVHAITFDYEQRHRRELKSAGAICSWFGVKEHVVFSLDIGKFGGSALTDGQPVPKGEGGGDVEAIPPTYVPARNTVFLSIALSYAEAKGARDIYIGVSSVDYSGYPDCRPAFIDAFEQVANQGTRAADEKSKFTIHAPLLKLTKAETVKKGLSLGVDFSLTHTCYDPGQDGKSCGRCDACRLRIKGFTDLGMTDPVVYAESLDGGRDE